MGVPEGFTHGPMEGEGVTDVSGEFGLGCKTGCSVQD